MSRFSFPAQPKAKSGVFSTKSMRITVLTPCLLRLETGAFTDLPTQTVWNRNLDKVTAKTMQNGSMFTIETEEVTFLVDVANRVMKGIILPDGKFVTDFEKGNLLGTARTLDMVNGSTKLEKGILSRSGVAVMDDSKSLLLEQDGTILPRETCSDLYFFAYGHDYRRCLKDFYRLTGPVPLIPKFALGNWWSRYRAYSQEEYISLMDQFIQRKLPITVATFDMDWHWTDVYERFCTDADPGEGRNFQERWYNKHSPGWTGYSWNTELFPDHMELLRWLKEQGFHVTLNVHPSQGIRAYEDCYGNACKLLNRNPETRERIPFDIADRRFVEAYLDAGHHPHEEAGVDFWWLDWQQGKDTSIPGLDPLWALNHYHTLDSGRGEKRPLILSRYAGLGSHRYPLGFSGDTFATWESLRFQPYFTNNAANAGYTWWSHDIGGHQFGSQDDELYLRWLQYGVFSPINRLHSTNSDYMGKEPWKRSYAAARISEDFLRLRQKLIPYLYTANYQTHMEGTPICMPMYYAYDCDDAYEAKNQYIFGSKLLVCPVTEPADKRLNLASTRVWLPKGRWTDFFTGQIYRGGQWLTMYRDLDCLPVLAGEGAIVPMYADGSSNDLSLEQPLEIHVWRGNGEYELYEDDGETKSLAHTVTPMCVTEEETTLCFTIHPARAEADLLPERRKMIVRFRDIADAGVTVNGMKIAYSESGICVDVSPEEPVVIRLTDTVVTRNAPKDALLVDRLIRLQAANAWKNAVLPTYRRTGSEKHIPGFLREALREFDALLY